MLIVEFADLAIGSAPKRDRTSMAKYLPKPLRRLYRGVMARAVNGLTSSNAAINKIKRHCHEKRNFGHSDPPDRASEPRTDRTVPRSQFAGVSSIDHNFGTRKSMVDRSPHITSAGI
jgi:hypothetical protein